jgi:folylpolyglutamate synthase/dihydropteroate synthase
MIQPGLERIGLLLKDVQFPWKAVHVAGTNGKGSICHYASHMLRRRSLKVGRFSSPHLIDRYVPLTHADVVLVSHYYADGTV